MTTQQATWIDSWSTLKGKYFHSYVDDSGSVTRHWQGLVLREQDSQLLVQLFSWLGGDPTYTRLVPTSQVIEEQWRFYDSVEEWREAGNRA